MNHTSRYSVAWPKTTTATAVTVEATATSITAIGVKQMVEITSSV